MSWNEAPHHWAAVLFNITVVVVRNTPLDGFALPQMIPLLTLWTTL